ncbi:FAD/NAD(P)-dependent oxidoreductase [Brevibacterium casei]|uniref:FAD-dependent oxidoreductase n=1 Tax=Brevibacterium casei TaxID=33889 RepID=A0A269ZHN8_9MICO|nr:NAD(P)/FAD-dependent oxidoreductase [Brevibacterium casei]MCT1551294.1 FAD-dependent oxidoreductase [Brevibacterium casei]MCT1560633.1 FAD-dependent oxidoreductase [Brevibacterium casei]MCT2209098.1 FAD-dependent oxidoreductase [Brevibacterium casei]PAK97101.1 FAD/NAD(P)-binding oxidoreductase [Brevibacterium casei]QPS34850.1 FAD-dependent oxidoreductase [Brevibacterium casei]
MNVDIAIIGAGPAGLAAANAAAAGGASSIVVIDSAVQPGGQFWRHRTEASASDDGSLHHGWGEYLALRAGFDASIATGVVDFRPSTSVWAAAADEDGFILRLAPSHGPGQSPDPIVRASRLIIATGGYDRQIPIPGWDLPGVMAAGGVQGFAKQNGLLPGSRFVIAGTGPFLLPVADTVVRLGGEVAAVLESSRLTGWLPHMRSAAGVPEKALEGAGYAWTLLRERIPYRTQTVITEILGDDRVEAVRTARIDRLGEAVAGTERIIDGIDAVGLGWGFTPQLELPVSLGAATRVDADGSLVATVDEVQRSSVPGLLLAGEVTGVGGAVLAVAEGRVAGAVAAAEVAGRTPSRLRAERETINRHRAFGVSMHLAHPVPDGWEDRLGEETIVCRCEEVPAGAIVRARDGLAATDARAQKNMTRAGMGWCQGRECGYAATCLSGRLGEAAAGTSHPAHADDAVASLAQTMKRPVAQPVPLSAFFDL